MTTFLFCASERRRDLLCRYYKGLSFLVRFVLSMKGWCSCQRSKGLSFLVRFVLFHVPANAGDGSKGLSFLVRFVPIDNQTGIKLYLSSIEGS